MDEDYVKLLYHALTTIQTSLNQLEMKVVVAERVLKESHPVLYDDYKKALDNERTGPLTVVAQMLEDIRKALRKNFQEE
jgi:hypothetical protein